MHKQLPNPIQYFTLGWDACGFERIRHSALSFNTASEDTEAHHWRNSCSREFTLPTRTVM